MGRQKGSDGEGRKGVRVLGFMNEINLTDTFPPLTLIDFCIHESIGHDFTSTFLFMGHQENFHSSWRIFTLGIKSFISLYKRSLQVESFGSLQRLSIYASKVQFDLLSSVATSL